MKNKVTVTHLNFVPSAKVFLHLTKVLSMSKKVIRIATAADLPSILSIVNESILNTVAIYDYEARSLEAQETWFDEKMRYGFPVIVAELDDVIAGFGSYGTFKAKRGYDLTVEHSVYVLPEYKGQGFGNLLLSDLIQRAIAQKLHVMIGYVDASNNASIALHKKFGFEESGHLKQVGFKFGQWLDVKLMQLTLI